MSGRQFNANSYRYGFNGKENDNETVTTGEGTQDYGLRIYNPSLGKFLSVDPLTKSYPWYSPYQFAGNKPIKFIDLDGAEEFDNSGTITPYIVPYKYNKDAGDIMKFITNNTIIALYNGTSGLVNAIPASASYLNTPGNNASTAAVDINAAIEKHGNKVDNYASKTSGQQFVKDAFNSFTQLENYDLAAQILVTHYVGGFIKPATVSEATTLNEMYGGGRKINSLGGDMNCAGCAQAGDATLKGYPSSALNHGITTTTDVLNHFGLKSWSMNNTIGNITSKISALGEGATGVIFGFRGADKVGHYFNVTVQEGKVLFLDFQKSGSSIMTTEELSGYKDFWLINTTKK